MTTHKKLKNGKSGNDPHTLLNTLNLEILHFIQMLLTPSIKKATAGSYPEEL